MGCLYYVFEGTLIAMQSASMPVSLPLEGHLICIGFWVPVDIKGRSLVLRNALVQNYMTVQENIAIMFF
jgi:hypothetical protein